MKTATEVMLEVERSAAEEYVARWRANYSHIANLWRNPMKPGPYNSTTHGPIPLSVRGRELLKAERDAACNAIVAGNWHANNDALSRARGDLAKYMGELEGGDPGLPLRASIYPDQSTSSVGKRWGEREFWLRIDYENGRPLKRKMGYEDAKRERDVILQQIRRRREKLRHDYLFPVPMPPLRNFFLGVDLAHVEKILDNKLMPGPITGTTPFNKDTELNQEKPMTEPTRLQTLQKATQEVLNATAALTDLRQNIESAKLKVEVPDNVYVNCSNDQPYIANHISALVKEQWGTLRDEALHRAEVRLWEAEAALARLLGSEPTTAKPRKPRAAK